MAALFSAVDENGPNDEPGQKDLTRLTSDSFSGGLTVTWNWDVISLSGNNTADACSLFDSDGDGFANFSLCEVWNDGQAHFATRLYTCGDARADRCTNPVQVSSFLSQCSVADSNDDPFAAGDSYPRDTKATCTIYLSDVGAANAQLLNVCSYPSQEPNSDPSDCVLVPRDGFLVIVKVASPSDSTQFPFALDGNTTTPVFTATGSQTSSPIPVRSDINHSLAEVLPVGWRLDSASCRLAGGGSTGIKSGTTISDIDVVAGATTTCTFNDTKLNPALTLDKTISSGDPYDSVGDVISYSYLVTNSGNVSLAGPVSISDDKATNESCPAVSTVGNLDSFLDPGESITCTASHTVTQADLNAGSVTNVATASADGTTSNQDTATADATQSPALTLDKTISSGDPYDSVGDVISYSYLVTNSGNVSLAGPVSISDDKALDESCPLVSTVGNLDSLLDPGESITCTASYTVTQGDLNAGSVTNVATASAGGTTSNQDTETATATQSPELTLNKTISFGSPYDSVGDVISYSYLVTNSGNVSLAGPVSISDDKATNESCPAVSTVGNLDSFLDPGESITCTASYTVTQGDLNAGSVTNVATASADGTTSNQDTETADATQSPALTLDKTISSGDPYDSVGDVISYSYLVTNSGNVSLAGPVSITDDRALDESCPLVSTVGNLDSFFDPGEFITCTASYTVNQADIDAGSVTNVAFASAGDTDSLTDTETADATQLPALAVDKVFSSNDDEDASGTVSLGDTLHYTITATNTGNVTLHNVSVSDSLTGGSTTCLSVAPAGTCVLNVSYVVSQADVDAGNIHNTGTADSDETPPVEDTEDVPVPQNPALTLDKSGTFDAGANGFADVGELISYEFLVTNTGNVTLTGVSVTDPMVSPISCPATTLAVGANMTCTGSYAVTQADIDAGFVYNLATADSNESGPDDGDNNEPLPQNPAITVTKTGSPTSVPETGGNVTFTYVVENTGNVTAWITSLSDDVFGTLAGDADCAVDTELAPGASCSFDATFAIPAEAAGSTHVNTFTAHAEDAEQNDILDDESESIIRTDVLPEVTVTKTGNPTSVPETGGSVTFTYVVENTGDVTAWITSLVDDQFGALTGDADCMVGTELAAGASCTFDATFAIPAGAAGTTHVDVFTAHAADAENNDAWDDESETITRSDVLPAIMVTKTGSPASVPETGGDVTFTYVVENTGDVTAWITSLVDDQFGTLAGDADCMVGTELAAGAYCEFSATFEVPAGDYPGSHVDVFTAHAKDAEENDAWDDESESIDYTDVLPDISVSKDASPTEVPETGGWVTFTVVVSNLNSEAVTLNSLSDSVFGDLNGKGDCSVPQPLAGAPSSLFVPFFAPTFEYTCSFTEWVDGDYEGGIAHKDTVTAVASDDDGNSDEATDDATVTFSDVDPSIDVEKYVSIDGGVTWVDADAATGPYLNSGTAPKFKFVITNTGTVDLSNVDVTDNVLGNISLDGTLLAGASADYIVTGAWAAGQHTNTGTASGDMTDGNGNTETDTDSDDANYFGASPSFTVAKECKAGTEPVPQEGPATFTVTFYNDGNVPLSVTADDGIGTFDLAVGETKSFEVSVDGPFSGLATAGNTVSASSTYTDGASHAATVSHESTASCRVGARANLHKTTNGVIDPTYDWTFAIFAGAHYGEGSGFLSGGPLMTASTLGDALGVLFDTGNLDPTLAYAVCEVPVNATAGWSSLWTINGVTVPAYNPHSFDPIKQSLGYHCVDIGASETYGLTAGGTLDIYVDNSYPGGEPRTPGYWKNWSSCTGGGQYTKAVLPNDADNEFWALDELLNSPGFIVGDLVLNPAAYGSDAAALCQDAVSILDQRDIETGLKASSDSAYTLAMHLMAAKLNFAAGAETCTAAADAVLAGQQLLEQYNFTGTGDYLRPKGALKADYYYALAIAKLLDEYNNGLLCGDAPGVDNPPAVAISSPSAGDVVSGSVSIAASAADDVGVAQVEFFVDGVSIGVDTDSSDGWSAAWDSTLAAEGSHSLSATATDTVGQTGSAGITVTVDNVPDPTIKVLSLGSSATPGKPGKWDAQVEVTVDPALAGAVVSAQWSDGKIAACTTAADGKCTIYRSNIPSRTNSLTLEVTSVALAGYVYDPSGATIITVNKP